MIWEGLEFLEAFSCGSSLKKNVKCEQYGVKKKRDAFSECASMDLLCWGHVAQGTAQTLCDQLAIACSDITRKMGGVQEEEL